MLLLFVLPRASDSRAQLFGVVAFRHEACPCVCALVSPPGSTQPLGFLPLPQRTTLTDEETEDGERKRKGSIMSVSQ